MYTEHSVFINATRLNLAKAITKCANISLKASEKIRNYISCNFFFYYIFVYIFFKYKYKNNTYKI